MKQFFIHLFSTVCILFPLLFHAAPTFDALALQPGSHQVHQPAFTVSPSEPLSNQLHHPRFSYSTRSRWGFRESKSPAEVSLYMFTNPDKCEGWTADAYLAAFILLFGTDSQQKAGNNSMRNEDKKGKVTYIPYQPRYALLNQWQLYEYPEFIKFIHTYPDYWQCISTLSHHFLVDEQLRESASPTVQAFVKQEMYRKHLMNCEWDIDRVWKQQQANYSPCEPDTLELDPIEMMFIDDDLIRDAELHSAFYEEFNVDSDTGLIYYKRAQVLRLMDRENVVFYTQTYQISWRAEQKLTPEMIQKYRSFYGDEFQHLLHQEAISILEKASVVDDKSPLFPYQPIFFDAVDLSYTYNYHGYVQQSAGINDFCQALLMCGQAVLIGANRGVRGFVTDLITHPCSTVAACCFATPLLFFDLFKLSFNVANVGVAYLCNAQQGKRELDKFLRPIKQNIDELYDGQTLSLYKVIEKGTELSVHLYLQHRTLGMMRHFFEIAHQRALISMKQWWPPRFSFISPESILVEAAEEAALLTPESAERYFCESIESGKFQPSGKSKGKGASKISECMEAAADAAADEFNPVTVKYHDALYHTKKGNARKSPRPIDGLTALKNSVRIKGTSHVRVGVSCNQIVMLRRTLDGLYHGYVIKWNRKLGNAIKKALEHGGLTDNKGNIICGEK